MTRPMKIGMVRSAKLPPNKKKVPNTMNQHSFLAYCITNLKDACFSVWDRADGSLSPELLFF